jgi:hypothetical protein
VPGEVGQDRLLDVVWGVGEQDLPTPVECMGSRAPTRLTTGTEARPETRSR